MAIPGNSLLSLSAPQLNQLRTQQFSAKLYLSVCQPTALLTATVNDASIAAGETDIVYDAGTGTGFSSIAAGQVLDVVTAYGTEQVRVKSITGSQSAGTVTVAANVVNWGDDDVFVIYEDYPLFQLISRFDSGGTFYKDYDTTWPGATDAIPPVVVMGGPWAGFMSGGSFDFTVDLTGSYAVYDGATISSTALALEPASAGTVTDNLDDTYDVSVTTAGQCWLKATVTDSNSTAQISRRRVWAHDTSSNAPLTDLSIDTLSGDWSRGWNLQITARSDADTTSIRDNALICLWHAGYYDGTESYIDGNLLFVGYVDTGSIRRDYETGDVTFSASTIDQQLSQLAMYAVSLEAVNSPGEWYQYPAWLTVGRIVHHILKWHSTIMEIADVVGLTDNTLGRKYGDVQQGNLLQMCQSMADSIQARLVSSRKGHLYLEEDALMLDTAGRAALGTQMELTDADSVSNMVITSQRPQAALVHVSGLSYSSGAVNAYCAKAPGSFLLPGAQYIDVGQQVLSDQTGANELAGRILAQHNRRYPQVRNEFAGYVGVLDIVPQLWYTRDIAASENERGLTWDNQRLVARSINVQVSGDRIAQSVTFDTENIGPDGAAVTCPSWDLIPFSGGVFGVPSWEDDGDRDSGLLALGAFSLNSFYYRDDDDTDWEARNGDLTTTTRKANFGSVDPWWWTPFKRASYNPEDAILFKLYDGVVYATINAGTDWIDITPITDPPNSWSDSPAPTVADLSFTCLSSSRYNLNTHFMLAEWQNGSSVWRGWLLKTTDDGLSWSWINLYSSLPTAIRPLWVDASDPTGARLFITVWKDGALYFQEWSPATPALSNERSLGSATQGEMEAETYTAAPVKPLEISSTVYVYGRMDSPGGLSGTHHIIKSDDNGATWSSVESGWGSSRCAALRVGGDDGAGNRELWGVKV